MADRPVTPHSNPATPVAPVTGHFKTRDDYAAWRPGGTNDYLLVYTVAGSGQFASAHGQQFDTNAGDLVLVWPRTHHDYSTPQGGRWELLWAHFTPRGDWSDLLDWPQVLPGVGRLVDGHDILPLMRRLNAVATGPDPLRDRLAMNALEAVLLACDRLNPSRHQRQTDPRLRSVLEHIARKLDEPMTVEGLAAVGGMSASWLAHLFQAELGVSVMHYVETRRIERAAQLLRVTPLSVKQIADQVGFASQFYFSLRFKKATGQSPTGYRDAAD
jgi:AraC family transcriptional regulator of arabinose operon